MDNLGLGIETSFGVETHKEGRIPGYPASSLRGRTIALQSDHRFRKIGKKWSVSKRNGWSVSSEMGGQFKPKRVVSFLRNTQEHNKVLQNSAELGR